MILSIIGIAIISLILILIGHSLWGYFYDLWISPHISSAPPAVAPYMIHIDTVVGDTNRIPEFTVDIPVSGTSNIADLGIDASSMNGEISEINLEPPNQMEDSKRNLKELFNTLKRESGKGGNGGLSEIGGNIGGGNIGGDNYYSQL